MDASTRTFFIAGVQHRPDWERFRHLVFKGLDELKLIGEPSNRYDKYAVKVCFQDLHLGYIPKPINVDVWALKDAGMKPTARLLEFDPRAVSYEMFKIQVTFTKDDPK
jgi:hypothetical protein